MSQIAQESEHSDVGGYCQVLVSCDTWLHLNSSDLHSLKTAMKKANVLKSKV